MIQNIRSTVSPIIESVVNQGKRYLNGPYTRVEQITIALAIPIFTILAGYVVNYVVKKFRNADSFDSFLNELDKRLESDDKALPLNITLRNGTRLRDIPYINSTVEKGSSVIERNGYFDEDGNGVGRITVNNKGSRSAVKNLLGQFTKGKLDGFGQIIEENNHLIRGHFVNGGMLGSCKVTYMFSDKLSSFEGVCNENGEVKGTVTLVDGTKFENCQFVNGTVEINSRLCKRKGYFDAANNGIGTIGTSASTDIRSGEFIKGEAHGYGTYQKTKEDKIQKVEFKTNSMLDVTV